MDALDAMVCVCAYTNANMRICCEQPQVDK